MTPEEKLEEIISKLQNEITLAWNAMCIAKGLLRAINARQLYGGWLFGGMYEICKREVVLSLAKLLIHHRQSISITMLLDHIEANRSSLSPRNPANWTEVDAHILAHRDYLDPAKHPLVPKIVNLRDRTLAHLDRKHINDPEAVKEKFQIDEIEECLREVHEIVNTYNGIFFDTDFMVLNIEQSVDHDLDYLVTALEAWKAARTAQLDLLRPSQP